MALVSVHEVSHSYGGPLLFDNITFHIERGERVCLLGRNGAGKSTLMRLIDGDLAPDEGTVMRQREAKIARLAQTVPPDLTGPVYDHVIAGLGRRADLLAEYHRASADVAREIAGDPAPAALAKLDRLHRQLDLEDAWQLSQEVERVLSHLQLDGQSELSTLSGGRKRRALLARALVSRPDLLLLDEPTNHLDIPSIEWLEEYLLGQIETLVFVTHDRTFVRKLATRVIEIDRGHLYDWGCDYDTFLSLKQDALAQEAREWEEFDKTLAQEETWIHQGTQARTTRNMGRVRALNEMREVRAARREREGTVQMQVQKAERTGKLVIEAKSVTFGYGGTAVLRDLTTTIERGDKVGIIGLNGSGKTTLLRVLLGELGPQGGTQDGTVRHGTGLQVAYFDQMRDQLDAARTVLESVNDGNPNLTINGQTRHVIGYLRQFLFPPERVQSRVKDLSGGERTRLMLARLFARPFNVLVMDEPTNDLDLETLELLEDLLIEYQGTLLLVSHDRALLNNVVDRTLALEEGGRVGEYAGGYDDWLWQRPQPDGAPAEQAAKPRPATPAADPPQARKISFAERRELEALPGQIETLEQERQQLYDTLSDPKLYQENGSDVARIQARLAEIDNALEEAYERWMFLEELPT